MGEEPSTLPPVDGLLPCNLLATVKPTFGPAVSHVIHGRTWGAFIPLSQEACSLIMHKQDKKLLQCFSLPPTSSPPCPDVTSNLNTYKSLREGEESFPSSSPKPKIFLKGGDWGRGGNRGKKKKKKTRLCNRSLLLTSLFLSLPQGSTAFKPAEMRSVIS